MRKGMIIFMAMVSAAFLSFDLYAQQCQSGNCVNGKGTMVWPDAKYDGHFKNGTMEGQGTMVWKDGKEYKGLWKKGKFNGSGQLTWPTGDKYKGHFSDGKMEGTGVMTWKTGDRYDGQWKNDLMNGKGTMRYASGMTVKGAWKDGKPVTESKKDAAASAMAGPWRLFCKCTPSENDIFDCPGTIYEFTADGKGTFLTYHSDGNRTGKIQWSLKGKVLSITEFPEESKEINGPHQYTYNQAKAWYAEAPRPYGPYQKNMVVCIVKRDAAH